MKKFDQAKRVLPEDRRSWIRTIRRLITRSAVIDWMQAYQPDGEPVPSSGLKPTDELKDKKACDELLKAD